MAPSNCSRWARVGFVRGFDKPFTRVVFVIV